MEKEKNIKAIQPNGDGTKTIKWASIIPLVGGHSIGSQMATGTKPEFLVSYPAFMSNDQHIRNYWPDVPYLLINPETNEFYSTEEIDEVMEGSGHKRPN